MKSPALCQKPSLTEQDQNMTSEPPAHRPSEIQDAKHASQFPRRFAEHPTNRPRLWTRSRAKGIEVPLHINFYIKVLDDAKK